MILYFYKLIKKNMKLDSDSKKRMKQNSVKATAFLKGLANKDRLLILCELAEGEKNVTTLIKNTGIAQTSMSQHLNKLKEEKIVDFQRDHRILTYRIINKNVGKIMKILHDTYCK